MIYLGTSGFSYPEWKGSFYPPKLASKEFLSFFATRFNTTEINNTFYRIPSRDLVAGWADQVPESFRFTLKLSQRITHRKKLNRVEEEMGWFLNGAEGLGDRLGCILVQLAPWFKQDLPLLEDFLSRYAPRAPLAFEFRHETWRDDETRSLLRQHGAAWAVVETDESPAIRDVTAPFAYVRLRKTTYTDDELGDWASWVGGLPGDCFVYFKHAEDAPGWAGQLLGAIRTATQRGS